MEFNFSEEFVNGIVAQLGEVQAKYSATIIFRIQAECQKQINAKNNPLQQIFDENGISTEKPKLETVKKKKA